MYDLKQNPIMSCRKLKSLIYEEILINLSLFLSLFKSYFYLYSFRKNQITNIKDSTYISSYLDKESVDLLLISRHI